jgi:hypothetical protein
LAVLIWLSPRPTRWHLLTPARPIDYAHGDRVCILRSEDLVNATDCVMHHLAGFLGIAFDPVLLTPTFNKIPVKANTSFKLEAPGILSSTLSRYTTLSKGEVALIERITGELYRAVLAEAVSF